MLNTYNWIKWINISEIFRQTAFLFLYFRLDSNCFQAFWSTALQNKSSFSLQMQVVKLVVLLRKKNVDDVIYKICAAFASAFSAATGLDIRQKILILRYLIPHLRILYVFIIYFVLFILGSSCRACSLFSGNTAAFLQWSTCAFFSISFNLCITVDDSCASNFDNLRCAYGRFKHR